MPGMTVALVVLLARLTADDDHLRAAVKAAQAREERLRTVAVSWKETVHVPKGARLERDATGLPLPRADLTVESTHRMVLDGPQYRLEHNNPGFRWQASSSGDGVLVHDGRQQVHRVYLEGRDKPPLLVRERPQSAGHLVGPGIDSVGHWCRRLPSGPFGSDPAETRTVVALADIGGDNYPEVRVRSRSGRTVSYFLDPRRDYVVRRVRSESENSIDVTDVEYEKHPTAGWAPKGWTKTRTTATGRVVEMAHAEVTEVTVNDPVPPETFRLHPIPGEHVSDQETGKVYRVGPDGGLEETDLDRGAGPPAERPVPGQLPAWPGRQVVRVVVIGGLVGLILAVVISRRRARPPHKPTS